MFRLGSALLACAAGVLMTGALAGPAAADEPTVLGNNPSECEIAAGLGVTKPGCPPLKQKKPGTRGLAIGNIDQMPSPTPGPAGSAAPPAAYAPQPATPATNPPPLSPSASEPDQSPAAARPAHASKPAPARPAQSRQEYTAAFQINFEFGSARLTSDARQVLERVGSVIAAAGNTRFRISGHTDSVGSAERNLTLSEQRAQAVVDYLVSEKGINPQQLQSVGLGQSRPINRANPRAPENRRVEITNLGG